MPLNQRSAGRKRKVERGRPLLDQIDAARRLSTGPAQVRLDEAGGRKDIDVYGDPLLQAMGGPSDLELVRPLVPFALSMLGPFARRLRRGSGGFPAPGAATLAESLQPPLRMQAGRLHHNRNTWAQSLLVSSRTIVSTASSRESLPSR